MSDVVRIFKALADETRLKILIILSRRRICNKGIAKHLNISEAAVSQHLKVLRESGIITGEKVGYYVHYTVQDEVLMKIIKCVEEIKDDKDLSIFSFPVAKECEVLCKTNKNKCCERL